ncbi:ATP-dependent RNA helicase [Tilletia horrida]|nr:ATP-dependent RNA helicase [Tilletia horrida]
MTDADLESGQLPKKRKIAAVGDDVPAPLSKRAAKTLKMQEKRKKDRLKLKRKKQQQAALKNNAVSTASASTAKAKSPRKAVALSALTWKPVALPNEAASAGGANSTDADFFDGLFDGDMNDYMGLQEVKGVSVKFSAPGSSKDVDAPQDEESDDEQLAEGEPSRKGKILQFLVREGEDDPESAEEVEKTGSESEETDDGADWDGDADWQGIPDEHEQEGEQTKEEQATETDSEDEDEEPESLLDNVKWDALDAFEESMLPGWAKVDLDKRLKGGLWKLGFSQPTKIQIATIPLSLAKTTTSRSGAVKVASSKAKDSKGKEKETHDDEPIDEERLRDIVGVAQTGSGKTMAYGLPILNHFLQNILDGSDQNAHTMGDDADIRPLTALILTPTRELAIQVSEHLQALVTATAQVNSATESLRASGLLRHNGKWISIVTVCGGMSVHKQRRLLSRGEGADVVVATPGRLWELLGEDDDFAARLKQTRFLVIDEADRMVEVGHFAEMDNILNIVRRPGEVDPVGDAFVEASGEKQSLNPIAKSFVARIEGGREDLQTFIFSATLSKDLQRNLTRAKRKTLSKKKRKATSTLDDLMMRVDFRDPDPVVVDLSPQAGIAEGVHEMRVECLTKEKDLYLYYFLLRYPGRTLVFLNSIDGIRRLVPILTHLGLHPFPLHSQLQQKQRLKNLDRFRAISLTSSTSKDGRPPASAVILATDVAARGLDIKGVDHVVHYQLPRSADTYVHRSGRTGRAGTEGVALALIDPPEKRVWNEICKSLNRKDSVASMVVEYSFFDPLRSRLDLAKKIDQVEHRASKESHDDAWLRKMAADADIDLDDGDEVDSDGELSKNRKTGKGSAKGNGKSANALQLKNELDTLLRQPLKARGVSFKYLTSGSRVGFAEEALSSTRA